MKTTPVSFEELLKKIEAARAGENPADLSSAEDLSVAVMHLISLEEHFFFTGAKTGDNNYFNKLNEVREQRIGLMKKLLPESEGETWCAAKHLLGAAMRLLEVGTKLQKEKKENKQTAVLEMFQGAYRLYSLFWALKLRLLEVKNLKPEERGACCEE